MQYYYFLLRKTLNGVTLRCPDFDGFEIEAHNEEVAIKKLNTHLDNFVREAGPCSLPGPSGKKAISSQRGIKEKLISFPIREKWLFRHRLNVTLESATQTQLEEYCNKSGLPKAEVVRLAIHQFLKKEKRMIKVDQKIAEDQAVQRE